MPPPTIPLAYRAFVLYIEPLSTLAGAYLAWFHPFRYLTLTHAPSTLLIIGVPTSTHVALRQLSNLYAAFALIEAVTLRATADLRVWRALLACLLVADLGHLYACAPLGWATYWDVPSWNAMDYGNILFVYVGAALRVCFLLGVGMGGGARAKRRAKKAAREVEGVVREGELRRGQRTPGQGARRSKEGVA